MEGEQRRYRDTMSWERERARIWGREGSQSECSLHCCALELQLWTLSGTWKRKESKGEKDRGWKRNIAEPLDARRWRECVRRQKKRGGAPKELHTILSSSVPEQIGLLSPITGVVIGTVSHRGYLCVCLCQITACSIMTVLFTALKAQLRCCGALLLKHWVKEYVMPLTDWLCVCVLPACDWYSVDSVQSSKQALLRMAPQSRDCVNLRRTTLTQGWVFNSLSRSL